MRLTKEEKLAIKDAVALYDGDAKVCLFGSRVDDDVRGGDIDLLLLSATLTERDKRKIKLRLYDALGEQKIDLLLVHPDEPQTAFVQNVQKKGVEL